MYLMYVDSSGNANYNDGQKAYCLTGIIVHESNWIKINNFVDGHKLKFFPNLLTEQVEYHAHEIYRKQRLFSRFNNDECKSLFSTFYNELGSLDLTIISIFVNKDEIMRKRIKFNPILNNSWERLLERFDMYIRDKNRESKGNEYGLVIVDSENQSKDSELKDIVWKIIKNGTRYNQFSNIIEDVMFAYSHWRNLTQIADMVCYCIFKNKESNEFFTKCFSDIKSRFRKSSDGRYIGYGLKIIPDDELLKEE